MVFSMTPSIFFRPLDRKILYDIFLVGDRITLEQGPNKDPCPEVVYVYRMVRSCFGALPV